MSRAVNGMGQFVIEGAGALPWTEQDEQRLRGEYVHQFADGREARIPPHVMTPRGPYFIGSVKLPWLERRRGQQ